MIKKIIYNSGVQLLGKAVGIGFSVVATAILTRKLGVNNYGQYLFIISFINLLVAIASWGTQIIGVRELSRAKNKGVVFGSLFTLRFILALIVSCFSVVVIFCSPAFIDIKKIALLSLPLVLFLITESTFGILFQTFLKMDQKTIIDISAQIVFFLVTLLLLKRGVLLMAPFVGWFAAKIIAILIGQKKSRKLIDQKISIKKSTIRHLLIESLPMGAQLILFTAYDQAIDSFIIKSFLGASQVAFYGLAYKIYRHLTLPAYFLANTIFPLLSKNKNDSFGRLLKIGFCLSTVILIFIIPSVIIFDRPIIFTLAGKSFSPSIIVLKILTLTLFFSYFNHLAGFSLIAFNRQIDSLKISFAALFWNLILNLIFIPRYGIIAAAWVTASTEALAAIISSFFLIRVVYNTKVNE